MIRNEEYISRAYTVEELVNILSNDVLAGANITIAAGGGNRIAIEVWYDESINTVILK
jgi:hypothetical protein